MIEETKDKPILPFKILSGLELMNTAPERVPALVDDLLLQVGVSMLSAKPKTGKSMLARQLGVSVAEGRDFLNRPTLCGDVLYLQLEGPIGVTQQHLKKLRYTETRGKIHVVYEKMPPKGELGLARLVKTIKSLPDLRLVIVDPASKLLRLMDSFNPDEVLLGIETLEQVAKDHNLHLMFLTHAKKKSNEHDPFDDSMGSTSFRGGTDTNIVLRKHGKDRIISTEQRWGQELEPTFLKGYNEETQSVELGQTVESQAQEQRQTKGKKTVERIEQDILDALDKKSLTQRQLITEVPGKSVKILEVLSELVVAGRVKQKTDGKAFQYSHAEIPAEVSV
jgi:RecA-family ATPase